MSNKRRPGGSETPKARGETATWPKRHRSDLAVWVVAILALLANTPVLSVDFVFDDHPIIEDSRRVNEMQLGKIWTLIGKRSCIFGNVR
jgi:hypothetical protein